MADRAKFLDFLDMIDGGGAGQRGNQFEGGGIFSALANLMPINPFGSEDPTRRRARDEFFGGLLSDGQQSGAISAAEAAATPAVTQRQRMSAAMADEARQRGLLQDALDPRGRNQMRPMAPVGSGRGTMGMPMQGSGRGAMGMPVRPQNYESTAEQMQRAEFMGQFAQPQRYESTAEQMQRAEFPMINQVSRQPVADDTEFMNFMQQVRNDPMFSGVINNPQAMRDIFNTYKQQMATR